MNKERLLNVAKALRESRNPSQFTMRHFHHCGTPGCAMGHYAARRDLQEVFQIGGHGPYHPFGQLLFGVWGATTGGSSFTMFAYHFDITYEDANKLFCAYGCGNAKTPIEAAEYIERYVAACRYFS